MIYFCAGVSLNINSFIHLPSFHSCLCDIPIQVNFERFPENAHSKLTWVEKQTFIDNLKMLMHLLVVTGINANFDC